MNPTPADTVRIAGPRLVLRAFQPEEIDQEWQAMVTADPMSIAELPDETAFRARLQGSGHMSDGRIDLAIDLDGRSIGRIQTFVPPDRELPPGTFDIGISLQEPYRGRGYGREAIHVLTDWLFSSAGAQAVEAGTDHANMAMRTVFEHVGWRHVGALTEVGRVSDHQGRVAGGAMTADTTRGCPVDESFDPLSPHFLADPFAVLAALPPDECAVFFAPSIGYYVITRYADIERVFADSATYSAAIAQAPLAPLVPRAQEILLAGGHRPQPSMVSLDEPAHARLRKPAARAFSMKRVQAMIPAIESTTSRLLDALGPATEFDLIEALAFPLPANIVFSLMGVPEQDYPRLKEWCGYRAALSWGRPAPEDQVAIATAIAAYRRYLRDLVDLKITAAGDDLTSDLLAIHDEDPERLTLDEIASILFSLSFAGHETTTGLIGNSLRRLLEEPSRWAAVVAQPELIPAAVEETLRFDPSVPVWRRVTTRATRLGGVELPEGARLFLWLAAAGRDASAFGDPDRFDLHRAAASEHLAFGKGLHYCLGANLGKLEAQIAITELARRYPRLELAGQQFTFHPNISFRGPQCLMVRA
jgi:cytochrome P450/RimJ/RimL family protein N-acetyltransferase